MGRVRVAVDGLTAAGKTTFGHELAAEVAGLGRPVFRASLDDFKRPWRDAHLYDRTSGDGYYRNAQDLDVIRALLLDPASSSGSGVVALCSIDPLTQIDHSATTVVVPENGVLIVDGVFALRPELNRHWELRVWIDVEAGEAIARGVERDTAMEGSAIAAEQLHRDRYHASEHTYMNEVDPAALAEVVIQNTNFDQPRLIKLPR
jgi:uridine kinase